MVLETDKPSSLVSCATSRIAPVNPFTTFTRAHIEQSIASRFEQIVDRDPSRMAVKVDDQVVTYGTLNKMANRIAHALRSRSNTSSEPIAVLAKNDLGTIATLLGIIKAGKIYVPLDVSFSPAWAKFILQDTNTKIVLSGKDGLSLAKSWLKPAHRLIDFESLDAGWNEANPENRTSPDALAQILYTSGTTGHPKGVADNHRNILHHVIRVTNSTFISAQDRMTLLRPPNSSGALMNAFAALLNGTTLFPMDVEDIGLGGIFHQHHCRSAFRERRYKIAVVVLIAAAPIPAVDVDEDGPARLICGVDVQRFPRRAAV